jgi:hypothetical protein
MKQPFDESPYCPLTPQDLYGDKVPPPTYGETFTTEQLAVRFFLSKLPPSWLGRVQNPDYAVDFQIELVERGEPTGSRIAVQVKGVGSKKGAKHLKRVSSKTLAYLRDKERLPAFLVLVDVRSQTAHWVFVQKYLHENVRRTEYRKHKIGIQLPIENDLADFPHFEAAIRGAIAYMADLHPGTPRAALAKRTAELQATQPHSKVEVSVKGDKEHIQVSGGPSISLEIVDPLESAQEVADFISHGKTLRVPMSKVRPINSPLLEKLMLEAGGGAVQIDSPRQSGCFRLSPKAFPERFVQLDGEWHAGTQTTTFEGCLPKAPLKVECTVSYDDLQNRKPLDCHFYFAWENWELARLDSLPWFEEIRMVMEEGTKMTWFIEGNHIGDSIMDGLDALSSPLCMLKWIKASRDIAAYFKLPTRLPAIASLTPRLMAEVDALEVLFTGGQTTTPAKNVGITFPIGSPHDAPPWSKIEIVPDDLKMSSQWSFPFLGETVTLNEVDTVFTQMLLTEARTTESGCALIFQGEPGTMLLQSWTNHPALKKQ